MGTTLVVLWLVMCASTIISPGHVDTAEPPPVAEPTSVPRAQAEPDPSDAPDDGERTGGASVGTPEGFGEGVTGGAGGDTFWVTSLADDGPGTLRAGLREAEGPRWIRFRQAGRIELETALEIPSDTTIDGRDARVEIAVVADVTGMQVTDSANIIIHGLVFVGGPATKDVAYEPRSDAINLMRADGVWIDHNTMTGWGDQLVGIATATAVTVSYNRLHDQGECVLVGARSVAEGSSRTRVTIHHNLFDRCADRSPRAGDGSRVHLYNNVVRDWEFYGVAAVRGAELHSEHNVFVPRTSRRAIIDDSGRGGPGFVSSTCDVAPPAATIRQSESDAVFTPSEAYDYTVHAAGDELVAHLEASAGRRELPAAGLDVELTRGTASCDGE